MERLNLEALDAEAAAFDVQVLASSDLDVFCSSSDWILPAARALMPERDPWIRRLEGGYLALMRARYRWGWALEPLEGLWGLACPLVGADPVEVATALATLSGQAENRRDVLLLCGLAPGSPRFLATVRALGRRYELRRGPTTRRHCASLAGGLDGFLSRRSAGFRGNLRQAVRRAAQAGIAFEECTVCEDNGDGAYARVLAVEAKSWKAWAGVAIHQSGLREFYALMLRRLAKRGAARLLFARREGTDLAYILGGVLGYTYRGLQFSFSQDHKRLSLGNLCQYHQIARLCEEGIDLYDLGVDVEYKRRWGETRRDTVTLVAVPR